eukprot:COSAG02_NODE_2296_length_9197_cov_11.568587_12_plen_64_part_01
MQFSSYPRGGLATCDMHALSLNNHKNSACIILYFGTRENGNHHEIPNARELISSLLFDQLNSTQ